MKSKFLVSGVLVGVLVAVGGLAMAGCRPQGQKPAESFQGSAHLVEEGENLEPPDPALVFAANCATCHGENGQGGQNGAAVKPSTKSVDELFRIVADGVPGTAMPAYRGIIGEGEVLAVVEWMRTP